jgi:hypothetical protein
MFQTAISAQNFNAKGLNEGENFAHYAWIAGEKRKE